MRLPALRQIALFFSLFVPFGLLHAWVLAEICIAVTDILFLTHSISAKNLTWLRQPWLIVTLTWWAWLTICSLPLPAIGLLTPPFTTSFLEAFLIIRLIIFTAALQSWLLTTPESRRLAYLTLALSTLWIGTESWQQFLTGHNLFGDPRWPDGSLTGPFYKPRAGDLYAHLLFLAALPPVMTLLNKPNRLSNLAGAILATLGVITSILIGQRMGTIFTALGLATTALLIPKLRPIATATAALAVAVLLLTPLISPATHAKLITETSRNLHHFALSPYGELFTRATVMGLNAPIHGWGYRGFRTFCPLPLFNTGLPALNIAPTSVALNACNLHPQNFYLQAFAEAGLPGLILFAAMNLAWLITLAKNLSGNPLRVGVFTCILTFAWPLASTDEFPTLYMCGWLFFALGLGLSLTHMPSSPPKTDILNA